MSIRILDRDIDEPSSTDLPASSGPSHAEVKAEAPTPEEGTRTEPVPTTEEIHGTPESRPGRRITFDWLAEMSHVRLTDLPPEELKRPSAVPGTKPYPRLRWAGRALEGAIDPEERLLHMLSTGLGPLACEDSTEMPLVSPGLVVSPPGPDGSTSSYIVQNTFFINSRHGSDWREGTASEPFQSFWPIRWWFALIDLLLSEGWDFSSYHPEVYLERGSEWRVDDETVLGMMYALSRLGMRLSSIPLELTPTASTVDPTTLAWMLFSEDHASVRRLHVYGDDVLDFLRLPLFLRLPRGLSGFILDAYGSEEALPWIRGCLTYDATTEEDVDPYNAGLARAIGLMSIPPEAPCSLWDEEEHGLEGLLVSLPKNHDSMHALLLHDSVTAAIGHIRFSGFRKALMLEGVCQHVDVGNCVFDVISSQAIQVNLVCDYTYLEWNTPADQDELGRNAIAYFPVLAESCPRDFEFHDNFFFHVGQASDSAAIELGTCATDVRISANLFVECVDGVTSDNGGSGIHIHQNAFILSMETRWDPVYEKRGGDGNGIDLKGVRPRTALHEEETEDDLDTVTEERWTLIHDNVFLGTTGAAILLHKGTSWVRIYNNYLVDNMYAVNLCPKVISMLPVGAFEAVEGTRTVRDPKGILGVYGPDWRSTVDQAESVTSGGVTRTLFTTKHIYIYRNVIAASWRHGLYTQEGLTMMVCDEFISEEEAYRRACGMSVQDLIIAHNTIDSNGGAWLVEAPAEPVDDLEPYYSSDHGISLSRDGAGDNYHCETASAVTLGDFFLGVAIYNNLFNNNYAFQWCIADESISQAQLELTSTDTERPNNLTWNGTAITAFTYYGIDYNSYYYPSSERTGSPGSRDCGYVYFDRSGVESVPSAPEVGTFDCDVRLAIYVDPEDSARDQYGIDHYPYVYAGRHQDPHLEENRNAHSHDAVDLFLACDERSLLQSFEFSRSIREEHSGLALAGYYLFELIPRLAEIWRTIDLLDEVLNQGAASTSEFPIPLESSTDIEGTAVVERPEPGAFEDPAY